MSGLRTWTWTLGWTDAQERVVYLNNNLTGVGASLSVHVSDLPHVVWFPIQKTSLFQLRYSTLHMKYCCNHLYLSFLSAAFVVLIQSCFLQPPWCSAILAFSLRWTILFYFFTLFDTTSHLIFWYTLCKVHSFSGMYAVVWSVFVYTMFFFGSYVHCLPHLSCSCAHQFCS